MVGGGEVGLRVAIRTGWAERDASLRPGHFRAGRLSLGRGQCLGKSVCFSVQASSLGSRKGSSALVSPAHVCRGRRARGAGRPFVAEKSSTPLAGLGFAKGLCVSVSPGGGERVLVRFRALYQSH